MGFNCHEGKMLAKESVRKAAPGVFVTTLVFLLLTSGVSYLLSYLLGNPFADAVVYIYYGWDVQDAIQYVMEENSTGVAIYGVVQLLFNVYSSVMSFGFISYTLRLARNENPGLSHIFDGFIKLGRVLWMNILVGVFTFLWSCLFLVPVIIAVGVAAGLLQNGSVAAIITEALMIPVAVGVLLIVLRYVLAPYFLLDDPGCTAREGIRRSKEAMKGHKGEFLMLGVSFLGWGLLVAIIEGIFTYFGLFLVGLLLAGVLQLWLTPYMQAAYANFYDYASGLKGMGKPSGGYAGPDYIGYDYHGSDGPEPF